MGKKLVTNQGAPNASARIIIMWRLHGYMGIGKHFKLEK
jgi:hypothetical protein